MTRAASALLIAVTAVAAADMRVDKNIPYAEPRNERQLLDVYAPTGPATTGRPVMIYIHGGGWAAGSKDTVATKPEVFTTRGMVFVAMNYRFVPAVKMGDIIRDVATAVAWTHKNATKYGGDPRRMILMGHSAGAQLAAILCTDPRYLQAHRIPLSSILGCIPVDGDTYDVPLRVAAAVARRQLEKKPPPKSGHPEKFGDLTLQRDYSAVYHVARGKSIPPFLLIHVANDIDTSTQAYRLWAALDLAGIRAKLFAAGNTEHVKLDRDIGLDGDPATKAINAFLDEVLKAR